MSLERPLFFIVTAGLVVVACSSDSTVTNPTDASAPDTSSNNADSSSPTDSGADTSQAADASDASQPPCPDEHGSYSIVLSGSGCGDTAASLPQCVVQSGCKIVFNSSSPSGPPALNGDPTIGSDGSFSNGNIKEGTVNRTGCAGAWDGTSTLTVVCGGDAGSQSCTATLTRTSTKCN